MRKTITKKTTTTETIKDGTITTQVDSYIDECGVETKTTTTTTRTVVEKAADEDFKGCIESVEETVIDDDDKKVVIVKKVAVASGISSTNTTTTTTTSEIIEPRWAPVNEATLKRFISFDGSDIIDGPIKALLRELSEKGLLFCTEKHAAPEGDKSYEYSYDLSNGGRIKIGPLEYEETNTVTMKPANKVRKVYIDGKEIF